MAAIWALKTKYIYDISKKNGSWLTLFYETLLSDFVSQTEVLQRFLNIQFNETAFRYKDKPSASSISKHQPIREEMQIKKWKTILSGNQIKRILNIVEKFGVELYDTDLMPHSEIKK